MISISGYSEKPVIVREIANVIDLLRSSGEITGSSEISGKYTITSVEHGLNDFEVITINDIDYVINDVTDNNFSINATTGLDFTGETWQSKAPYYLFGHPNDIVSILAERNKAGIYQYQKYPLIALFQDIDETIIKEGSQASLNLIIANRTQPNYHAEERYSKNFEPVLYPILEQFERALQVSKDVQIVDTDYGKVDRLYWGKQGLYGNDGNIFNDFIDAIEIENLNLRFKNKCK